MSKPDQRRTEERPRDRGSRTTGRRGLLRSLLAGATTTAVVAAAPADAADARPVVDGGTP